MTYFDTYSIQFNCCNFHENEYVVKNTFLIETLDIKKYNVLTIKAHVSLEALETKIQKDMPLYTTQKSRVLLKRSKFNNFWITKN